MFVKVAIKWPDVDYTQVDADVDLSNAALSVFGGGYIRVIIPGVTKQIPLHRYIMRLEAGDKRQVHHINGDTKDNRRCNLRIVTRSENIRAKGKTRRNTSGLIGVYKRLRDGKYFAQIGSRIEGKQHIKFLGSFWCKNEAGRAYDAAVRAIGGDYMTLNFPDEVPNTLSVV